MKLKFSWNAFIQTFAIVAQTANAVAPIMGPDAQAGVALSIGAVQGVVAMVAHFRNPNGTRAVLPSMGQIK